MREVYYKVHLTPVLNTTRISNVDSIMFVNRIIEIVSFELSRDRERCFLSCHESQDKEEILSPHEEFRFCAPMLYY